ncbi:MAG: acyl--CoA ligase [Prevotella sp.]|nr:acyl--CoA ligase [Prevotella sp.]
MSLEDYLYQNAQRYSSKVAVVCGDRSLTYAQLWQEVERRSHDFRPYEVVCFRSSQDIDFLVTYMAVHLAGGVAAPLEHGMPDVLFERISSAVANFSLFTLNSSLPPIADILYTTGTTGQSKGVMVSHRALIADAENLIAGQGFSHDLVFVVNGPLNHIGSLSKIWPCIILGATILIIEGMKDLNAFFHALDYSPSSLHTPPSSLHTPPSSNPKFATFFVPATIRMILQFAPDKLASYADKLDFIESGAAPLPQADMLRLCELLPKTRLYNTYASTETGIIATYNYNDGRCMANCLGRPMPHSRVLITSDGLIACQGDTLMSGYVGDPELTATVLRDDTIFTSDIGTLDEEGMLHLSGRASDVINVGGFKVSPIEVEEVAMSNPLVSDCICISEAHPVIGRALKLLVVTPSGQTLDKRSLARYLADRLELYKVPMLYEQVDTIARTYNGKLDRKYYLITNPVA